MKVLLAVVASSLLAPIHFVKVSILLLKRKFEFLSRLTEFRLRPSIEIPS